MRIGAVIAEFNPFHNGHKYVIDRIKSENDAAVAIMSGNFVQRGDIAVFDKFTRAKAALFSGVDLVIELPVEYAVNNAEIFAWGGVFIANSSGVVNSLYFGSESGDIEKISKAADLLLNEERSVSDKIKSYLKEGYGYSAARELAFEGVIDKDILSKPNNILAIEYVKALKRLNSRIESRTFSRINTEHDGDTAKDGYASASMLRDYLKKGDNISEFIPDKCMDLFKNAVMSDTNALDTMVLYTLRRFGTDYLANINDVSEGLENRIYKYAREANSMEDIVDKVCTKRYSRARIRRILLSAVLGIEKSALENPRYIRVLAMNRTGINVLSEMKKKASLPIITKAADYKELLERECVASDIYAVCCKRKAGMDFTESVFIDV